MNLKSMIKSIPGLSNFYRAISLIYYKLRYKSLNTQDIFTNIYNNNSWDGGSSVSGTGSDFQQTQEIVKKIPEICERLSIGSMLDIPCGDFYWMRSVDFKDVEYVGADIVDDLIEKNRKYVTNSRKFEKLNLLSDKLPSVDMIFSRDCLVHFSYDDIFKALFNICDSGSKYLLTTTFSEVIKNRDIVTGQWRPINLQIKPFYFPEPILVINEECTEGDGAYADKSLGLWDISELKRHFV